MRSARLDGCVYKLRNSALPPRNWGLFALPPPPSSHTFLSFLNFFRMDFPITAEFNLNWHLNVQSMWLCRNNKGYILNGFIRQKCFIFPQNQRQCPFTKIVKSRQLQFLNTIKKTGNRNNVTKKTEDFPWEAVDEWCFLKKKFMTKSLYYIVGINTNIQILF